MFSTSVFDIRFERIATASGGHRPQGFSVGVRTPNRERSRAGESPRAQTAFPSARPAPQRTTEDKRRRWPGLSTLPVNPDVHQSCLRALALPAPIESQCYPLAIRSVRPSLFSFDVINLRGSPSQPPKDAAARDARPLDYLPPRRDSGALAETNASAPRTNTSRFGKSAPGPICSNEQAKTPSVRSIQRINAATQETRLYILHSSGATSTATPKDRTGSHVGHVRSLATGAGAK